jgi:hypothetical protein
MKKLITLLLLFTLVGFLSGNQVIITNDYQYIVSTGKTYNFSNGNPSNNVKYDRTNKIAIQNNKVLADPLKYHYAFFWDEANDFIGYYKTNKGITTSGAYLGQVNTQSIPLPLNAYSFALVRYDNDYVLVNGYTIEDLFIDNNLAGVDPDDFNDIPIAELNGLTLNEVFDDGNQALNSDFNNGLTNWSSQGDTLSINGNVARVSSIDPTGYNIRQTNTSVIVSNNVYYIQADLKSNQTFTGTAFLGMITNLGNYIVNIPNTTARQNVSGIITSGTGTYTLSFYTLQLPAAASGEFFDVFSMSYYNLTALGLTSLTKATLDTYFSIYQNGVNATYYATNGNVSTVDGYYFAAGNNLETTNFIETTNGTFRVALGDIVPVLPNQVINLLQNVSGSHRYAIRFFDINLNQITSGITIPNYASSSFSYNGALGIWNNGSNVASRNDLIQIAANQGIYYIQFGVQTGNVAGIVSATNRLISQTVSVYEPFATPTTTLNLTFLFGIGNEPDKATMDGYYAEYEEYLEYLYVCCNIFATQTISFETIYFDDGVSTEIERLGSILIFTLIGFTLMIFGFASKRRIFNLLSIGAFIVLGVLLAEFAGFLIIVFGLVVLNLYYTFLGDI